MKQIPPPGRKKINTFCFNFRTYKCGGGGVGVGVASSDPSEVFFSFFLDDVTSAPDFFNQFSFFSCTHFEISLVMVSYYRYEI